MKIALICSILWFGLMLFLGGAVANFTLEFSALSAQASGGNEGLHVIWLAVVTAVLSAALFAWLMKTRYDFVFEFVKRVLVLGLLVITGITMGFCSLMIYRAPEAFGSDVFTANGASDAAENAKREFGSSLSPEVVRCDQTLGLAALKSSLRINPWCHL